MAKKSTKKAKKAPKAAAATAVAKAKPARKTSKRKAAKSPLSKAELREFRLLLLAKRRDLVGDMAGIQDDAINSSRHENSGGNMPTHPADIGSDNFEQEFSLGLLESERALLEEIYLALRRIDEGTYGICIGTGEPIGLPRLRARPWAKYCIEYQRMIEKGLVRAGAPAEEEDEDLFVLSDEEEEDLVEEEPAADSESDAELEDED